MSGTSKKITGGTRNYASNPSTRNIRKSEYQQLIESKEYLQDKSYFHKSGGFVVVHKNHNLNRDEMNCAKKLARKGYKVYLENEYSTISGTKTKDGYIYKSPMDIKSISKAGKYTIKSSIEKAASQGAETVILFQRTKLMNRQYVKEQIDLFKDKSPKRCVTKIKNVIIVGKNGNVHRWRL